MDIIRRSFILMVELLDDHTGCSCLNTAKPFPILLLSLFRYSDSCRGTKMIATGLEPTTT